MGAQWKHTGRIENSNKRGALISQLVKEIAHAARLGSPQIEHNARLRVAVEAAKKASVPKQNIERAIKKGAGLLEGAAAYETVFYEGFAPHRVPVIIECLTDNKNRTAADIRVLFRKGHLEDGGSVSWMFDRVGMVDVQLRSNMDLEEAAIEVGAQSVDEMGSEVRFLTLPEDLDVVTKGLIELQWVIVQAELSYQAKDLVVLEPTLKQEVIDFLDAIDEHEDVHRVYAGLQF